MSLLRLSERRANIENPAVPLTSNTLLSLFGGQQTDSGIPVTEYTAMKMSAVYRGASLVSGLCGALPINVYKVDSKDKQSDSLLASPHPEMTPLEFWRLCGLHRMLWGNFYAQKIRNGAGGIVWLNPIHPRNVAVLRASSIPTNPTGKIFKVTEDNGKITPCTSNEIFHVPGLGYEGLAGFSPVRMAAQAIGLSLAVEKYGSNLFGRGNLLSGLLQTDSKLNQDQAEALQQRWSEKFSGQDGAHRVAVLDAGAKFQSLTMPNDDAEMLASRDFQVTEIARFMGIPPYLMYQTDKTTSWGSGLEQQARGFNQFDLHPNWLAPTEQRVTKELLPRGKEARYDIDQLLRGDSEARAKYYAVLREAGALSPNEIRFLEDLPPRPGGDTYIDPAPAIMEDSPMGSDPNLRD